MFRRLFTFASATSLLLCVAVAVTWVRSDYHYDYVSIYRVEVTADGSGKWWFAAFSLGRRQSTSCVRRRPTEYGVTGC
jgi:hypothetical protein